MSGGCHCSAISLVITVSAFCLLDFKHSQNVHMPSVDMCVMHREVTPVLGCDVTSICYMVLQTIMLNCYSL